MVRFVLDPEGVVTPDIQGKLPGRGVWVSSDRKSLEKVIALKSFARGFKGKAKVEGDLIALTERLLMRRILGLITMARKAGVIALGNDQVQSMAREAAIAFRIEASDGSKDGRSKIRTLAKAMNREQDLPDPIVLGCFTAAEIGQALARESIVHAAIKPCKLAKSMKIDVHKWSGFRELIPMDWPDRAHEIREK
jgi:predicted RNA-binding protein YlxR (DUF448 family)